MTEPEALVEEEGRRWLRLIASRVPADRAIVEVGVYQGSSLLEIARGAHEGFNPLVYGIDPWGMKGAYVTRPAMRRRYGLHNMEIVTNSLVGTGLRVILIRSFGTEVAKTWSGPPVGLLFIDAVHRETEVVEDFLAWRPHLGKTAVVAFDDYDDRFPGVIRAVDKLFGKERVRLVGTRLAWVIV